MLRLARSSSPKRPATDARVVAIGAFRVEYVLYELHVEGRFHVSIVGTRYDFSIHQRLQDGW
jgi:hypothetical protein